ncbi:MAG: hypothetical protein WCI05_19360 [Myxococcales bacterium]|jgi:hypothetical protein
MKTFEVSSGSPEEFLEKVRNALSTRTLGKVASMRLDGQDVVVIFSKMGTSEVRYRIERRAEGFRCSHTSEKIAFAHRAFRGDMESKLRVVFEKEGAQVTD